MNPESLISSTAIQVLQNFCIYNNTDPDIEYKNVKIRGKNKFGGI